MKNFVTKLKNIKLINGQDIYYTPHQYINIIIGANGSGKSLLINSIQDEIIRGNSNKVISNGPIKVKNYLFNYQFRVSNINGLLEITSKNSSVNKVKKYISDISSTFFEKNNKELVYNENSKQLEFYIISSSNTKEYCNKKVLTDLNNSGYGIQRLIDLLVNIFFVYHLSDDYIFLIDEIENHFHLCIQDNLIQFIITNFEMQFFITTHSAFIVSYNRHNTIDIINMVK